VPANTASVIAGLLLHLVGSRPQTDHHHRHGHPHRGLLDVLAVE